MKKDIITMSDEQLSLFQDEIKQEIARRNQFENNKLVDIHGQEYAKRALVVAAAGNHSITLFGPKGCGKTLLRHLGHKLGIETSYETFLCPCGYWEGSKPCQCDEKLFRLVKWVGIPILSNFLLSGHH